MGHGVVVEVFGFWKARGDDFRKERFGLCQGVVPIYI